MAMQKFGTPEPIEPEPGQQESLQALGVRGIDWTGGGVDDADSILGEIAQDPTPPARPQSEPES